MPFEIILLLVVTAAFLCIVAVRGYTVSRDPLHPLVLMAPLFLLGMVAEPIQCLSNERFLSFFPDYRGISFAMLIQSLGILVLFAGIAGVRGPRLRFSERANVLDRNLTAAQRCQLQTLAWVITAFAMFGFWIGIYNGGGFVAVYSRVKGIGDPLSGYFGEAQNLGIAALIIFALGHQLRPLRFRDYVSGLIMASPLLIHGTFGGRRGPLFLGCIALYVSFWIAKGRLPKPRYIAISLTFIVACIMFMASQRGHLYLGSESGIQWDKFWSMLKAEEISAGDNFVVSSGAVIATNELKDFHYGRRLLITFFIRPIPRQIWRTKYDDASMALYGVRYSQIQTRSYGWAKVLGWRPLNGFATNSIVDLWMEFWWGYLIALWALGRFIGVAWRNFRVKGGYWFVVYASVAALSIYLPTQSLSAFVYRLLYLSLMTLVFWKFVLGRTSQESRQVPNGNAVRRLPRLPIRDGSQQYEGA